MRSSKRWIGLDVSANDLSACVLDDEGYVLAEATLANCPRRVSEFLQAHGNSSEATIALEAGGWGLHLTRKLKDMGFDVRPFDARQASKFLRIRQNKTDTNDARGLADIARLGNGVISEVIVRTSECQRLRTELALRQRLVSFRVGLENALKAAFRLHGGKLPSSTSGTALKRNVAVELKRLKREASIDIAAEVLPTTAICATTRTQIERIDRSLKLRAKRHAVCKRLMTVPGIGPLTAISFYSAIEDPFRFHDAEKVGAYLGLAPTTYQSGGFVRQGRVSKMGNALTRHHLVCAAKAVLIRKEDSCLRDWANGVRERSGFRRAEVALARKLAVVMLSIWKSGEVFRTRSGCDYGQDGNRQTAICPRLNAAGCQQLKRDEGTFEGAHLLEPQISKLKQ